jgi:glucosamine-6-phosphate deaminase
VRVLVTPDYQTLSQTAAELVIRAAGAKPDLVLGLPTGNTPMGMYAELVKRYRAERLDFARIRTFNLDEYLDIPRNHPMSYRTYMRERLFDLVNIPAENIHIPDGDPDTDHAAESERYETAIGNAGGIDLLILGIGRNGHIGFNEPGSAFDSRTRAVVLSADTVDEARPRFGGAAPPARAITMGVGTLLEARRIVLLAAGTAKAHAVDRMLHGPVSVSFPASALQLHPRVIVIVDEAAAPNRE